MTKITTGLASAGLVALALGAVTPGVASATPSTAPAAADDAATETTAPAHISEITRLGDRRIVVNGVAAGATSVRVAVPDGVGGLTQVVDGRFSLPLDASDLGKQAVLHTYGPAGEAAPVPFTIELRDDDGSTIAPSAPVVHAVSQYEPESFVVEGTVSYDPLVFDRTEVIASVGGQQVRAALDENGSYALDVPVSHLGAEIELVSWRTGLPSTPTVVEGTPASGNDASESFPLDIASPAGGTVVTDGAVIFEGSAIPNSTIAVTRDDETSRTSATLCETRVAANGDWSCTSPTLPGGDHATTVTETPTWSSASSQSAGTAFRVAAAEDGRTPALPRLSSMTRDADGDLVVRVIANRAGEARLVVGDDELTTRGVNGRFTFTLDGALAGRTATVTGLAGSTEGRSLDLPLVPVDAPAPSPLQAPVVHAVTQQADRFVIEGTTSYSPTDFDVPGVLVQVDGSFVTVAAAVHDGAFVANAPLALAGREIEPTTTRGATLSDRTPLTVAATDDNTAPATFPLEVTSPADGEQVAVDTPVFTGEGVPGSTVSVVGDISRAAEICTADVLPDGTWSCEADHPLAHADHTVTITETPYWASAGTPVASRSFSVGDADPETRALSVDGDGRVSATALTMLTGSGHPGATVTVHPFGLDVGGAVSGTVGDDGRWSIGRGFGATVYASAVFVQTGAPGADQTVAHPLDGTRASSLTVDGDGRVSATALTRLTGTGDAGATVTLHPFGVGRGSTVSATVGADGRWTLARGFGPAVYGSATFEQTEGPGADQTVPFPLDGTR